MLRDAASTCNMTAVPEGRGAAWQGSRAGQQGGAAQGSKAGQQTNSRLYLLLVVALLDERGPDGPWCNGVHSNAALNQVCC